ncbi:MAG: SGNH/GDSL hydrolase family protein [Verrucomicrobia bacterium]|nr:SGNH/GDSL hydrolase family protein [Verrucomicrobiota bacterium]
MNLSSARHRFIFAIAWVLLTLPHSGIGAEGFELTAPQHERLQKYLPNTLAKLEKKAPVSALIVGDSVTDMTVPTNDNSDTLKSYPGVFLSQLADQFYYTGGLRVLQPKRGQPEKSLNTYGQEITVQNLSRGGRMMIHAMNVLEATAWKDKPDLVLVSFGINDATSGMSLATYRQAVQDVINTVKNNKADLILIGSTPTLKDPPEEGLALTRPYVDTMREVAQAAGVFFADLGDISWLVRVDEPMKDLEMPAPKKPKDGAVAALAPTSAVKIPLPEALDPDPDKRAARLFHQVATHLRRWFDHDGTIDLMHPNTAMHRLLGRRLFTELLDGPRDTPWKIGTTTARLIDSDHCEVIYRIENISGSDMRLNLLPLITSNWKPKEAETQIELKAGQKSVVTVTYLRGGTAPDAFSPHEPLLRLPVMILANGVARIEDLRARLQNCVMLWNLGAQFNQEGGTTVTGRIVNPSSNPLAGKWQAEWLGQKFSGDFKAPANGEAPVKINIKLPTDNTPPTSQRGTLGFSVTADKLTLQFPRVLEIVQNLGLKQTSPLFDKSHYQTDKPMAPPAPGPTQPGATLKVDADPMALYLTWDIHGLNLVENSNGVAVTADINIDARSYGKRMTHGVTETIRVTTSAADSAGTITPIKAWVFGNGYATEYTRNLAQAVLSSRPDGSRRLTLMLPRSMFQLHEWALGNGNSQLGFSTRLGIWQAPDAKHPAGTELSYSLFDNSLNRDDAESLAALELTAQPTKRWTVHLY